MWHSIDISFCTFHLCISCVIPICTLNFHIPFYKFHMAFSIMTFQTHSICTFILALHFGNVPHSCALPNVVHKVNFIMNLYICRSQGIGGGALLCLLPKSGRHLLP
jgi:hypothetical protein